MSFDVAMLHVCADKASTVNSCLKVTDHEKAKLNMYGVLNRRLASKSS